MTVYGIGCHDDENEDQARSEAPPILALDLPFKFYESVSHFANSLSKNICKIHLLAQFASGDGGMVVVFDSRNRHMA